MIKKFLESLFSIKNEYSNKKKYKVLSLFGVRIKFKVISSPKPDYSILIKYDSDVDRIYIDSGSGYESKTSNSIYLFLLAFDRIRSRIQRSFELEIQCEDFVRELNKNVLSYVNNDRQNITLIPDSFFVSWPETGVSDYDKVCQEIEQAGQIPPIYNECFWIGNVKTHISREDLLNRFSSNKNFKLVGMDWKGCGERGTMHGFDRYVSLPEHTKYKYLLDIRGRGYSGRVKFLLFSNRPIFYIEREDVEFYNKDLKPFEHYIPVKSDLSDLQEKYDWAEANPDKARQIAANALEFAKTHLTREAAIRYYSKAILDFIER